MRLWLIILVNCIGVAGVTFMQHGRFELGAPLTAIWIAVFGTLYVRRWRSRTLQADPGRATVLFSASPGPVGDYQRFAYRAWRVVPALIMFVASTAACAWITWSTATDSSRSAIVIAGTVLFGVGTLYLLRIMILFGRVLVPGWAGLIIDGDGVLDATRLDKPGYRRIAWNEMAAAQWIGPREKGWLTIELSDPREYLERQHGYAWLSTLVSLKTDNVPIKINGGVLKASYAEVAAAVERYSRGTVRVGERQS